MAIGGVRTNPADYDDADLVDLFGLNKTCSIPPKPSTSGEMAMIYINDQIIACVRHPIDCKVYDKVTNTWLNYGEMSFIMSYQKALLYITFQRHTRIEEPRQVF